MNDDKKLSTSDIVAAGERSSAREIQIQERAPDTADVPPSDQPRAVNESPEPLVNSGDAAGYRTRWGGIQTGFVDEPRKAVEEADALVAEVMTRLAQVFAEERKTLEAEWERSD